MDIIPVIDIRDGIVVHARGGERANYQPLKSLLTQSVKLEQVIDDLLAWYPFKQLYIADLDAIEQKQHTPQQYQHLIDTFPQLSLWLDAGITEMSAYSYYPMSPQLRLVLGSETLTDLQLLKAPHVRQQSILSLDKKSGSILGSEEIAKEPAYWTQTCIAMSLDNVGTDKGPDFDWLKSLMKEQECVKWYAAGGVRDEADLSQLAQIGATGVLVASALHTGKLGRSTIERLSRDITLP